MCACLLRWGTTNILHIQLHRFYLQVASDDPLGPGGAWWRCVHDRKNLAECSIEGISRLSSNEQKIVFLARVDVQLKYVYENDTCCMFQCAPAPRPTRRVVSLWIYAGSKSAITFLTAQMININRSSLFEILEFFFRFLEPSWSLAFQECERVIATPMGTTGHEGQNVPGMRLSPL